MKRTLLLIVFACVAYAQPPVAWWENPVANGLSLSESQRDQINKIVGEARDRIAAERQEAERWERELEDVFNRETVEWRRGRQAIEQLANARGVLTRDIAMMTLRLRTVLTADQWRTLQARGITARGGPRPDNRGRQGSGPPR